MESNKEFAERKALLDGQKAELVRRAIEFAEHVNPDAWKKLGKTQFTSLLEASTKACCVEELQLFIKYKKSKKGSENWIYLSNGLCNQIDNLKSIADEVSEKAAKQIPDLHLELTRLFLGYFTWEACTRTTKK